MSLRLRCFAVIAITTQCVGSVGTAHAAGMSIGPVRMTLTQNSVSVPCVEEVTISNNVFTPATITTAAGCSVRWTHTTNTKHSSTSDASVGNTTDPWNSGTFRVSDPPYTRAFNLTGTFAYFCSIHSANMQGTIIIT